MGSGVEFGGQVHWFADQYKILSDEELDLMRDSLASEGLIDPITLSPDGVLLDGRHRLRLCEELGIEPRFRVHEGDPVAFIVAVNSTGRMESAGERSMAVAWRMWEAGLWNAATQRWVQGAASQVRASARTSSSDLKRCGQILAHDIDMARDVMTGRRQLREAYDEVKQIQRERAERERAEQAKREREAQQREEIARHAPDILEQVSDRFTMDMAYAAYRERDKERLKAAADAAEMRHKTSEGVVSGIGRLHQYDLNDNKRAMLRDLDMDVLGVGYIDRESCEQAIRVIETVIEIYYKRDE